MKIHPGVVSAAMCGLSLASMPLRADNGLEAWDSLLQSTASAAQRGDVAATSLLALFVQARAPWGDIAVGHLEANEAIEQLKRAASKSGDGRDEPYGKLLSVIAERQGAMSRQDAQVIERSLTATVVPLGPQDSRWLIWEAGDAALGEVHVRSSGCTPELTAFAPNTAFPSTPTPAAIRVSSELAMIDVQRPVALRVRAGDCEGPTVRLELSYHPSRVVLTASALSDIPVVEPQRMTMIDLGTALAQPFRVQTESGYLYEVFAASPTRSLDPALTRSDPANGVAAVSEDDDSGWGLGARLDKFVGTGEMAQLAAMRVGEEGGTMAVFVNRIEVPRYDPTARTPLRIDEAGLRWVRVALGSGSWQISTTQVSEALDPAMEVLSASGESLGSNDDVEDGSLAAAVHFRLSSPAEVYVKVMSVDGTQGTVTLQAVPGSRKRTSNAGISSRL